MLYFLLTIIAIGVLLISQEGKALLDSFLKLAMIGGALYALFWIVIFAMGLLADKSIRDTAITILGAGIFWGSLIYWIVLYNDAKKKHAYKKLIVTTIVLVILIVVLNSYGVIK